MKHLTVAALCLFALTACGTSPAGTATRMQSPMAAKAAKKAPFANEILIQRVCETVKQDGKKTLLTFEDEEFNRVFIVTEASKITRADDGEALTAKDLKAGQRLTVDAYRRPKVDGKMPCDVLKIQVH